MPLLLAKIAMRGIKAENSHSNKATFKSVWCWLGFLNYTAFKITTLVFIMGASKEGNPSPSFAQLRTYNLGRNLSSEGLLYRHQTFSILSLPHTSTCILIRKFQNEEGMDVPTHWAFLCLDILLSQGTNLAALMTNDWQVFSALLSFFPPSITLILGNNWVTYCLFLVILEGSNFNCGRNKKLYVLSYVAIFAPLSVRRDLKHLFQELIRCYFSPKSVCENNSWK